MQLNDVKKPVILTRSECVALAILTFGLQKHLRTPAVLTQIDLSSNKRREDRYDKKERIIKIDGKFVAIGKPDLRQVEISSCITMERVGAQPTASWKLKEVCFKITYRDLPQQPCVIQDEYTGMDHEEIMAFAKGIIASSDAANID